MTYPRNSDESSRTAPLPSPPEIAGPDPDAAEHVPIKVCPRCSVQSETAGDFCPHCASPYSGPSSHRRISKRLVIGLLAAMAVIGSATGIALKINHDNEVTAQRVAAAQAKERVQAAAKAQADAAAAAAKVQADAAAAAASAQEAADDTTRAERQATVTALEASVVKDARDKVEAQLLAGPILSASCTPLGGGSADDLTALSGTFECFAVHKKNTDGTSSGYTFNATVNWNDGSYTWRIAN